MCVYRKFPLTVLRLAQRGDPQWIENLLRLDPMASYDPKIKAWVNQPGGETTLARRKLVNQWTSEGLDTGRQLTARMVKFWFGGYIRAMANRFGNVLLPRPIKCGTAGPLASGEILDLFHAWAQDCSPKRGSSRLYVRDEDLEDLSPESWRSAIRPYRKQWDHIIRGGGGWNSG